MILCCASRYRQIHAARRFPANKQPVRKLLPPTTSRAPRGDLRYSRLNILARHPNSQNFTPGEKRDVEYALRFFSIGIWASLFWFNRAVIFRKVRFIYRKLGGFMEEDGFPQMQVKNLTFSDDTTLDVSNDNIIVFVGSNNSGKSATLNEIRNYIVNGKFRKRHVLKDIKVESPQTAQEISEWIDANTKKNDDGVRSMLYVGKFNENRIEEDWEQRERGGLRDIGEFLTLHLNTEQRLQAASPVNSIEFAQDVETHPLHKLYMDEDFESQVDAYFFKNFKDHLIVNRGAGPKVRLHVGTKIPTKKELNRRDFITAVDALPALHEQGDGMRSFAGVLISILAARRRVSLLDEPEAFLHPPQAAALGKLLAQHLPQGRQLFIATHSSDFVKGLLESSDAKIRIVRLERRRAINLAHVLDPVKLRSVWSDLLLRYSGILDGLFHEGVIICEGDTDFRFYSAVLESNSALGLHADMIFVHGGGKGKIAAIISSLRAVGVPVKAIADFDVLAEESTLKKIVEALGGKWADFSADWKITKDAIDRVRAAASIADIKKQVEQVFDNAQGHNLSEKEIGDIRNIIKQGSGWAEAKRVGKSYIASGQQFDIYEKMEERFCKIGLFIVPVGEVEGFCRFVGGKGPKWVLDTLNLNLSDDPRLEEARKFVMHLISDWIVTPVASP